MSGRPVAGSGRTHGPGRSKGLVALLALASACVTPVAEPAAPAEDPLGAAVAALDRDEFVAASRALERRIASCEPGDAELRQRAALLLATAELDVANRDGSPDRAALLASSLILDRETSPERAALARTIYRLALDQGASPPTDEAAEHEPEEDRPAEHEYEDVEHPPCAMAGHADVDGEEIPDGAKDPDAEHARALPNAPAPTTNERLADLERQLAAAQDSIQALRDAARRSAARAAELEAELERIRTLLKGRPPPP